MIVIPFVIDRMFYSMYVKPEPLPNIHNFARDIRSVQKISWHPVYEINVVQVVWGHFHNNNKK